MKKESKQPDIKLRNELVLIVIIKALVLVAIWWFFFKDQHMGVTPENALHTTQTATKHSGSGEVL